MSNNTNFGYYVFGRDMNNLDLKTLHTNGVSDLFLNFYAISLYGNTKVEKFIKSCKTYEINVHLWVQSFYDGGWINPKTSNLTSKINEIKKYTRLTGLTGIHLDYLRYPSNAYKTNGGAEAITDFVKTVKKNLPNGMVLSCAVMPEREGKKHYGQDIEKLGKIVDFVVPMQYKGNYNSGTSWLKDTTKYFSQYATVWSALQSYKSDDNPTVLSYNELSNDVKTVTGNGAKGAVLFRYGLSPSNFQFKTQTLNTNIKTIDKKIVNKLAVKVKDYVETNHKFPSKITIDGMEYNYGLLAYLFSYHICNINKNVSVLSVKNNTNSIGDSIKENIYENDYRDISKRVYQYIEKNKVNPNYATTVKSKKKLKPRDYIYMMARIIVYYYNHSNTYPRYAVVNTNIWK